jgi:hypothetical protein
MQNPLLKIFLFSIMETKLNQLISDWAWFRNELNLGDTQADMDSKQREQLTLDDDVKVSVLFKLAEAQFKTSLRKHYDETADTLPWCCKIMGECEEKFNSFEERYQHVRASVRTKECTTKGCRKPAFVMDWYNCKIIFGDMDDSIKCYLCEAGHASYSRFVISSNAELTEKEFMSMRKAEISVAKAQKEQGLSEEDERLNALIQKAKSEIDW